jgi:hypothetical protein
MPSAFSWPVLVPSALRAPAPVNLGVRPHSKKPFGMPHFPKVSRREILVIGFMLLFLYGALGYLYLVGEMSLLGIVLITVVGVASVLGSVWVYSKMWEDID